MLRGRKFSTSDEVFEKFRWLFIDLPQDMFFKCFESLFTRIHKCINIRGGYFEKLLKNDFILFLISLSIVGAAHVHTQYVDSTKSTCFDYLFKFN